MTLKSFFHRHHDDPTTHPPPPQVLAPLNPRICYATASAGQHPTAHTLLTKIEAIAEAGFDLVEVAWQDLEVMAGVGKGKGEEDGEIEKVVRAAEELRKSCEEKNVKVFVLMPFSNFEGYEDETKREAGLQRARKWFKVMNALNCQMLQIGSNNDPDISPDPDMMANDLRLLADEAAKHVPPIRIAYEMWAWGTYVNTWEHTVDICVRVNRPNFGLCLDTFQIAAHYYKHHLEDAPSPTSARISQPGSPTSLTFHPSPNPPIPEPEPNSPAHRPNLNNRPSPSTLSLSLDALTRAFSQPVLREKIFYLQISDAVLPSHEQLESTRGEAGNRSSLRTKGKAKEGATNSTLGRRKPTLEAWSDGWRVLPEEGFVNSDGKKVGGVENAPQGQLPVLDVLRAVVNSGWRGVWSYEVFYPPLHSLNDPTVPSRWARAAKICHMELLNQLEDRTKQGEAGQQDGIKVKDFEAQNVGRPFNMPGGHGANAVKTN